MNRFIEHIVEPHRLLIYWQARESAHRSRYYVGQIVKRDQAAVLEYDLEGEELAKAREHGFLGYPAFSLGTRKHTQQVVEAFMRRLPPRNRGDFAKYLELRAIPRTSDVSDFALLGYSGAKLPNDGFELVHPFDEPPERFEVLLEVAGFRHESEVDANDLMAGASIAFLPDPDNNHDSQAIRMEWQGRKIGYVPRGHLGLIHRAFGQNSSVTGEVFRKNGSSDRPLIYVLTRIAKPSAVHSCSGSIESCA